MEMSCRLLVGPMTSVARCGSTLSMRYGWGVGCAAPRQTGPMAQVPGVYGGERADPAPGPRAGHACCELTGGLLGGQLIEVTGWAGEEITAGAYLIASQQWGGFVNA